MSEIKKGIFIKNGLLLLTLFTVACSNKASIKELKEESEKVSSWAATEQMIGNAWIRDAVPTTYAKQTLIKAESELQKSADKIEKMQPETAAQKQYKSKILEHSKVGKIISEKMSIAVGEKNKSAVKVQLAKLESDRVELQQLSQP
ncbi:MAG: hypothetical protein KME31_01845 [Tolypothrix carrinoi HA7290-LM1]|jgi:hypothetical protein|nr:hypothetical protein [Tolypothrix carrinoi HA7290-LM1]